MPYQSSQLPPLPEDFEPPVLYRCVWCGWLWDEPERDCPECDEPGRWRRVIYR